MQNSTKTKGHKRTGSAITKIDGAKDGQKFAKLRKNRKARIVKNFDVHEIVKNAKQLGMTPTVFVSKAPMLGIPGKILAKLKYADHYTQTHTSGALQTWNFRANSAYDPDYTYTGHQPTSFDEYAAFFMYYRVKSCAIKATFSSLTSLIPIVCVVVPCREIVSTSNWSSDAENSRSQMVVLADIQIPAHTIEDKLSTAIIYDGQLDRDQDFGAQVTTNPAKVWFWKIVTQSANKASTTSVAITVELILDVEFSQKQFLTVS